MKLEETIERLHRSSSRMMELLKLPRDKAWRQFLRRETWIHIKRTTRLAWLVFWKGGNNASNSGRPRKG